MKLECTDYVDVEVGRWGARTERHKFSAWASWATAQVVTQTEEAEEAISEKPKTMCLGINIYSRDR